MVQPRNSFKKKLNPVHRFGTNTLWFQSRGVLHSSSVNYEEMLFCDIENKHYASPRVLQSLPNGGWSETRKTVDKVILRLNPYLWKQKTQIKNNKKMSMCLSLIGTSTFSQVMRIYTQRKCWVAYILCLCESADIVLKMVSIPISQNLVCRMYS